MVCLLLGFLFKLCADQHVGDEDLYLVRYRSIAGEIIREYTCTPYSWTPVVSLSKTADRIVDAFYFSHETIMLLHLTYLEACQLAEDPEVRFIDTMTEMGMPVEEAKLFWGLIDITNEVEFRERVLLNRKD